MAVFATIVVYGWGYFALSPSGATRFLEQVEQHTMNGEAQALCDLLTADMQVSIVDHTGRE